MGRALQLLTDHVEEDFRNSLNMLVQLVDAVEWEALFDREPDAHVYLYEKFLEKYDSELRKESGTYYTPTTLVREMVRLVDEVLRKNLECDEGFADPRVTILDPAMGTGTFLVEIIDLVVARRTAGGNSGFQDEAVEELAQRLIGFEKQMAAYAVAQMRISQSVRVHSKRSTLRKLRLHLCDTLADPWKSASTLFGYNAPGMQPLLDDVEASNHVKRDERVTVVIGNPPDRERAHGEGGWIENGAMGHGRPLLDDFRLRGDNAHYENKLKNLYVYFWRWATFKVFEQHRPGRQRGVVCFISTAGFLRGPGFRGMRSYLRRECTEGWIIDLSPEGKQPPVRTRFFPGVQRELAIAIFVRDGRKKSGSLATVHYTAVSGERSEKERQLAELAIGASVWRPGHAEESALFTSRPTSNWHETPELAVLLPWKRMGVQAKRTWVTSTDRDWLLERWDRLVHEPDTAEKRLLFRETKQWTINSVKKETLYGEPHTGTPLANETGPCPEPTRVLHRAFDRQWLIPDIRLLDRAATDLWRAAGPDQLFIIEQHQQPLKSGPALLVSALVPDMHCFNNNGGRVYPVWHADGSPNFAPGFLEHLANSYGLPTISVEDVVAYTAGVAAHPAFTSTFTDELNSPGVRIPWTADREVWNSVVEVGRRVIWAATFGERCVDPGAGRPGGATRLRQSTHPQVQYAAAVDPDSLPERLEFDAERQALIVGAGLFLGVDERMRQYDVGGRRVLDAWLAARSRQPHGRVGSPLDRLRPESWLPTWSIELAEILSVLRLLTAEEAGQAELLDRVLDGPTIDVAELTRRGVLDPPRRSQGARPPAGTDLLPGMEQVDTQEAPPVRPLKPASPDSVPPARARRRSARTRKENPDGTR